MKFLLPLLLAPAVHADVNLAGACADLHPGQYVVIGAAGWRRNLTALGTSRGWVRIELPLLDAMENVCDPLTLLRDGGYFVCAVRAGTDGGACDLTPASRHP